MWPCPGWQSWQLLAPAPLPGLFPLLMEPEPGWQQRCPRCSCPHVGGHLHWRFPLQVIALSKSDTETLLLGEAALLGAGVSAGRAAGDTQGGTEGRVALPAPAPLLEWGERCFSSARAGAEGAGAPENSRGCGSRAAPEPAAPGAPGLRGGCCGVQALLELGQGWAALPLGQGWLSGRCLSQECPSRRLGIVIFLRGISCPLPAAPRSPRSPEPLWVSVPRPPAQGRVGSRPSTGPLGLPEAFPWHPEREKRLKMRVITCLCIYTN